MDLTKNWDFWQLNYIAPYISLNKLYVMSKKSFFSIHGSWPRLALKIGSLYFYGTKIRAYISINWWFKKKSVWNKPDLIKMWSCETQQFWFILPTLASEFNRILISRLFHILFKNQVKLIMCLIHILNKKSKIRLSKPDLINFCDPVLPNFPNIFLTLASIFYSVAQIVVFRAISVIRKCCQFLDSI